MSLKNQSMSEPDPESVNMKEKEKSTSAFKDSLPGIFGPSAIAFLAALLATLLGQHINASVETSKVIRLKLEEAYFRTLTLPRYAADLNSLSVAPVQAAFSDRAVAQYNMALKQYSDEIAYLMAVADLYEDKVTVPSHTLKSCSTKFIDSAASYFITAHKLSPQNLTNTPFSPKQLEDLVALRLQCENTTNDLRKAIATTMKRHLSYWPI